MIVIRMKKGRGYCRDLFVHLVKGGLPAASATTAATVAATATAAAATVAAASTTAAAAAILAGLGFVDLQAAAANFLTVESCNSCLGLFCTRHLDESKAG